MSERSRRWGVLPVLLRLAGRRERNARRKPSTPSSNPWARRGTDRRGCRRPGPDARPLLARARRVLGAGPSSSTRFAPNRAGASATSPTSAASGAGQARRRVRDPAQPSRRPDADPALSSLAVLHVDPPVSQRRLSEDRGASTAAQASAADLAPLAAAARELNQQPLIDYDEVYRLKSQALELVFRGRAATERLRCLRPPAGHALRDFGTFNALCEVHGPAWRSWPADLRHPAGTGLDSLRGRLAERVEFHQWLQFHLDRQLARAGREIGLITDVPVGFASDGFDAWRWQDFFAPRMRVGAPPDEFFRDGQDWGLPAARSVAARQGALGAFRRCDPRRASRHAAGVRLDHVMGLFRLFWIPDGMSAAQGAYVRYPAAILLGLLARESRRAGAFVVGEDLGLVEPTVRRHLRQRGSMSYRLLWFEGSDPSDLAARRRGLGRHPRPADGGGHLDAERARPRLHHLRQKLVNMTHLPDGDAAGRRGGRRLRGPGSRTAAHRARVAGGCARRA